MTKDQWIQCAKALLFDSLFSLDSAPLKLEADMLLNLGGGYDPEKETAVSELRWPND